MGNLVAEELRDSVDRLPQKGWLCVFLFVPPLIVLSGLQPEGPAKIDDFDSALKEPRRKVHRHLRRRCQKHHVELCLLDGLRCTRNPRRSLKATWTGAVLRVRAMLHQMDIGVRVTAQQLDQFFSAVATKADNADTTVCHE
jgi:hypothetical protein